jgi:L-cysteine/cystine lyase
VSAQCAYLNTASLGPVSSVYAQTLAHCTASDVSTGRAIAARYANAHDALERIRSEVAALIAADRRQIALTQSTSDGLAAVIGRIDWQPGDEVVTTSIEHEACTAPLLRMAQRAGIHVRVAPLPQVHSENIDWLLAQLSARTRLVAFSAVCYLSGYRLPIDSIVHAARSNGAMTLLDAAQCLGAAPLHLPAYGVDFCAMPLQKWLCGPEGLGALYVRDDASGDLRRDRVVRGWGTLEATATHLEFMRNDLGWEWVLARTAELARHAMGRAAAIPNWTLETPDRHAGLVTISSTDVDVARCAERLAQSGFVFRYRPETNSLRIATAFFNTKHEIDSFFLAVRETG